MPHHALHIEEIILNIFGHCCPPEPHWTVHRRKSTAALAALARSCRAFKEPALDVLWSELVDLTPLPRCVPEACGITGRCYTFKRRLDDTEWHVLRSYTRRIWHILGHANPQGWVDNDTLIMICTPSIADTLFPSLRSFFWQGVTMIPAVHISVPSLTTICLQLTHDYVPVLKDFLRTVGDLCPNVHRFRIYATRSHSSVGSSDFDETICDYVRRLANLRLLSCHGVNFDAGMMLHLSKSSTLKHFSLNLNGALPFSPTSSVLVFPTLARLETSSHSLETTTELLSYTRLPVVEEFNVSFHACPSKEVFRSCIMTVRDMCSPNSLAGLRVYGVRNPSHTPSGHRLTLDDLRPCMALAGLSHVHLNLPGLSIDLTDGDLLELVSTLPHIQTLRMNTEWGWRTSFGITLRGLSQLLRTRPSLFHLCIAIHTESYANAPLEFGTGVFSSPKTLTIDLADSLIQPTDVPGLVEAFWKLGLHTCAFSAWDGLEMHVDREGAADYKREWRRVFDEVAGRSLGTQSLEAAESC